MGRKDKLRTHYIACNLCEAICGLEIRVENGAIRSIRGDPDDPVSKGHICPKAVALQDVYTDPDRLRTPLKKDGRGWRPLSWKAAFDEVAQRLRDIQSEHGKDSVAVYLGNPTVHNSEALLFGPLFYRALGTANRYSATSVDQLPEQLVSQLMFGHSLLLPLPDLDRTGFHLIFGANPVVSNGSLMTAPGVASRLRALRERGGRLVVVDPRRTETAALADRHLFIRPGSDVFVLAAMLQVVFSENLLRLGRLGAFTQGLDEVRELVGDLTPEKTAALTGVDPAELRALVRDFCAAASASCYGRLGVSTQRHGTLAQWLIMVFNIVTGNFDVPGGSLFSKPAFEVVSGRPSEKSALAHRLSRVRRLPSFNGEFPVAALAEEIATPGDGQIRALVTSAGNPVLSTPNGGRLDAALGRLDFMVSIDIYINETTRHADIILPPLTTLERCHYDVVFQALAIRNGARFSQAVFRPGRQQRSDLQIFTELAWRLQAGPWPGRALGWLKKALLQRLGSEWLIDRQLRRGPYRPSHGLNLRKLKRAPHGLDLGPLQPCLPGRLATPDKTVRLAPAECVAGLQRLSAELPALLSAPPPGEFDLLLIGRRDPRSNNSWLHNSRRLVKGKPRCLALVHPHDAAARGLADGDLAEVRSRVGSIRIAVAISDEVMAGVISIPHGWGHDLEGIRLSVAATRPGVNSNLLTDDRFLDTLSGNAALNGVPVSLARSAGPG